MGANRVLTQRRKDAEERREESFKSLNFSPLCLTASVLNKIRKFLPTSKTPNLPKAKATFQLGSVIPRLVTVGKTVDKKLPFLIRHTLCDELSWSRYRLLISVKRSYVR